MRQHRFSRHCKVNGCKKCPRILREERIAHENHPDVVFERIFNELWLANPEVMEHFAEQERARRSLDNGHIIMWIFVFIVLIINPVVWTRISPYL